MFNLVVHSTPIQTYQHIMYQYLCSYTPVEPAHIGWVSSQWVHPPGDEPVVGSLHVLDVVVEVRAGRHHAQLPQDLTPHHQRQAHTADPAWLLQAC